MRYTILSLGLLVCSTVSTYAFVKVDYKCVSACTAKGLTYSYCYSSCLYDDDPQQHAILEQNKHKKSQKSQIDYKCLNDCKARGYVDQFCKQQCSS